MRPSLCSDAHQARYDFQCPTCRAATRAPDGVFMLPNNPLVLAAVQAICCSADDPASVDNGWRIRNGNFSYEFWNGAGGRIRVVAEDGPPGLSLLTLDTALSLLAGLASPSFHAETCAPRRNELAVGAPAVLWAKNYRRYGVERLQFAAAVDEQVQALMRLRFDIANYPAFDPRSRSWSRNGISRASVRLFEAPANDSVASGCCLPLRFGAWAEHWFTSVGPKWLSPLPQAALELDHRDNRGPDALAKKILVLAALNCGAKRTPTFRTDLRTLLRRAGELRVHGASTPHYTGRLADRVEEALLRLHERRLMLTATPDRMSATRSNRLWFENWLDTPIDATLPWASYTQTARRPSVR